MTNPDGSSQIMQGTFDEDTNVFAEQINNVNGGNNIHMIFQAGSDGTCTSFAIANNGCEQRCKAGKTCSGEACSCSYSRGLFQFLPRTQWVSKCGPGNAGDLYATNKFPNDDDKDYNHIYEYCFVNNTPYFIYIKNMPASEFKPLMSLGDVAFESLSIVFTTWNPNHADPSSLTPPAGCSC